MIPFLIISDLYRIAPAMLRQASYGTIKIGTYQSFKRLLVERPEGELFWFLSSPSRHVRCIKGSCRCAFCRSGLLVSDEMHSPSCLSDETLLTNVICGILSGVISSTIANPTDVLKVAVKVGFNLEVLGAL